MLLEAYKRLLAKVLSDEMLYKNLADTKYTVKRGV